MLAEKLTLKELVSKHMYDRNHNVTDEELQNVEVGVHSIDEEIKKRKEKLESIKVLTTH